jgi:hypothetical protein
MKKIISITFILLALAGCTTSSGVLRAGDGYYTITTGASPGSGGLAKSQQLAYAEANEHCQKLGKKLSSASESNQPMSFWGDGKANTSVRFKCE